MIAAFLANPAALYSLAVTVAVILVMVFIFATSHGGAFGRPHWPARFPHRPRPLPTAFTAADAIGRLLHIRWPVWLLDWAWDRQATPGPDELLRKAKKARHRTDRWALLRRAQGGRP